MDTLPNAMALAAEYDMLPPCGTVLCAVSGGADSMCLLHFLNSLGRERGFSVTAAHYNHHLRGEESMRDAAFVSDWCGRVGIPCVMGEGDVAAAAQQQNRGVEETARTMRYAFLDATAKECGAAGIATAHHAADNVETVLLHLIRGTGLRGLCGIPPVRGSLIRPLLTTEKSDILAYLEQHSIPFVTDSSNDDLTYTRNRLRHEIIPLLCQLNPNLSGTIAGGLSTLRRDEDYLSALAATALASGVLTENTFTVPAASIAVLPDAVAPRAARLLLEQLHIYRCTAAHLDAIVALARSSAPSGETALPGGVTARRVYGDLTLSAEDVCLTFAPLPLSMPGDTTVGETGWSVSCRRMQQQERSKPGTIYLRCDSLQGNLYLRPRQPGDAITLPGRCTKRLKNLFIDDKVPRWQREKIPVLCDGTGVVAVAGYGGDARCLAKVGDPAWEVIFTQKDRKRQTVMHKDIKEVLFTQEQLDGRVTELAEQINRDYAGQELMLISVLRGSFVFMADLLRKLTVPCKVDFMAVSSYGTGTISSGQVQITKDLVEDITGRNILVVEDILDSGNTLSYLLELLRARHPASMKLCTLLDKPERRVKPVHLDYSGFSIPDAFVVGYGLDYAEHYRNLPYIGILKPSVYGGEE